MTDEPTNGSDPVSPEPASIKAAFGATNRARLINTYFAERGGTIAPGDAWAHVYRLLLWIDQTTGLAHCYESDKSQPGKRWYARSLAFHDWVASALHTTPGKLAENLDWLFMRATKDLTAEALRNASKVTATAERQRSPYEGKGFPQPGEDPELEALIKSELGTYLKGEPPSEIWTGLVQRIRQHLALENKRKNLVGEGFEDVLAQVMKRAYPDPRIEIHARRALNDLPGFNRPRKGQKPNKVDVAILKPGRRILITAKWSVRADREKQFVTDYDDYNQAESDNNSFDYVFVTNEFDPARLMRACEQLDRNNFLFNQVVHINTGAIRATYGAVDEAGAPEEQGKSMRKVLELIEKGRLVSLDAWLQSVLGAV